uniref:CSON001438 protein n=1 Tax=Culicoides sonorensis TaxID=179676 RepID=A0A336MHF0_CULSO
MAFNWDALDIGNVELEHSQNYFDTRHIEHERLNEQNEEFVEKIIQRSKPIAVFKGKRLLDEFQSCDDQPGKAIVQQNAKKRRIEVNLKKPEPEIKKLNTKKRRIEVNSKKPETKIWKLEAQPKKSVQQIKKPEQKSMQFDQKSKKTELQTKKFGLQKIKNESNPVQKKENVPRRSVKGPTVPRLSRLTQYAEAYTQKRRAMIERHKKEQEEKNKPKQFRARSLPKFIKAQKVAEKRRSEEENVSKKEVTSKVINKRTKLRRSRSLLQ